MGLVAAAVLGQPQMDALNSKVLYVIGAVAVVIVAVVVWRMWRKPPTREI